MNKQYYEKKAADHFRAYQAAVEVGDTKAMKYHEQEYLTYKKAAESCTE
jgi:hypothetical protein